MASLLLRRKSASLLHQQQWMMALRSRSGGSSLIGKRGQYVTPLRSSSWSMLLSTLAPATIYLDAPYFRRFQNPLSITLNDHRSPATSSSSCRMMLASSSAVSATHQQNVLYRIAQWIYRFFQKCQDAVLMTFRGTEIALRLSPLIVLTPASMLAASWNHNDSTALSDWTWSYFRSAVTALGPAFVKYLQWVATRRDIFPPNICDRLSVLHDRGISHPWNDTQVALQEAFGDDYTERGLQLDKEDIIGTGSAAQVYKGNLTRRDTKTGEMVERPVAIKVLHPDLEYRVQRDLWFVQTITDFLHSLPIERIRVLNLPRAASNFGAILQRQADLRVEADNLKGFRANFYRNDDEEQNSAILFPRPIDGWISKNVLVEDLVNPSTPIAEYLNDSTEEGKRVRKELASPLLRAFLKMVFLDNFVHCDLHSGNVLVQTTTVKRKPRGGAWSFFQSISNNESNNTNTAEEVKRQIVFLDAGIATSLDPTSQRNLRDLFRAVILNDGKQAGLLMVERATNERCSEVPGCVEAFSSGIEELVSEFHDRRNEGLNLGAVRIGSLLSRVLDLCRIHGVEIDPAMASIVISTLVLEGLGRSLAPNLNLIDFAVPFVLGRGRV